MKFFLLVDFYSENLSRAKFSWIVEFFLLLFFRRISHTKKFSNKSHKSQNTTKPHRRRNKYSCAHKTFIFVIYFVYAAAHFTFLFTNDMDQWNA